MDCCGAARSDCPDEEISSTIGSLGTPVVFWVDFCAVWPSRENASEMESLIKAPRALEWCYAARSDCPDEEISSTIRSLGTLVVFWVDFCAVWPSRENASDIEALMEVPRAMDWCGIERRNWPEHRLAGYTASVLGRLRRQRRLLLRETVRNGNVDGSTTCLGLS